MKRIGLFLTLIVLVIGSVSCKKDPGVNDGIIKISDEKSFSKTGDSISVSFTGSITSSCTIKSIKLLISLNEDPSDNDDKYTARLNEVGFNVTGVGLVADTVYYYRYIVRRYSEEFKKETIWEDSIRTLSTKDLQFVPLVKTIGVNSITQHDAIGVGQVLDNCGSQITKRGLCWSTSPIPTIDDSHGFDSLNDESFSVNMRILTPNTKYYYRAFAINSTGSGYGEIKDFTTLDQNAGVSVYTLDVADITANSATFNGKAVINKDGAFTSAGFLWGRTEATEDTIHISKSVDYHGLEIYEIPFEYTKAFLDNNTTYYVRAFVVEKEAGNMIKSSILKSFRTLPAPPEGSINGIFSVGEGKQVYFSKGNLQYQASSNTWRFAENQWVFVGGFDDNDGNTYGNVIGSSNNEIDSCYSGWIDLFNWGTSGYNHGAVCYQPWEISNDYENDYKAYGNSSYNLYDQSGQADWGYNAISNGGNVENSWRTLTKEEWEYLFKTRETTSGIRYAKAQVNGVNGIILLPDNWVDNSVFSLQEYNTPNATFTSNMISLSSWNSYFSNKGVVFLPEAGQRDYRNQYALAYPLNSCYWASSQYPSTISEGFAYCVAFGDSSLNYKSSNLRCKGFSVRLVCPAR